MRPDRTPLEPRRPDAPPVGRASNDIETVLDDIDPEFPDVDGVVLVGADLDLPDARTCTLLRSRLHDCTLGMDPEVPLDLQDVVLDGIDLTGRRIIGLVGVELVRCRLGGADLSDTPIRDVTFRDCVLDLASLRGATLERVVIDGGRAEGLDCTRAQCTDVRVTGIGLESVAVDGIRLDRVDLTGASLDGFRDFADLRGATVSIVQALAVAPVLANALGLDVRSDRSDGDDPPADRV